MRSKMTTPNAPESGQQRLLTEAIAERRATPAFDGSPVPDEVLSAILRAGLGAPSGYNLQPWRFVVVRSPEQKRRLREAAMGQAKVGLAGTAATLIAILYGLNSTLADADWPDLE
jgi:nitroreductase